MQFPAYFISHGGGPWPWVPEWRSRFSNLEESLARIPDELGEKPKAVLVISGHWEESEFSVMSSPRPPMVYDYYGFPPDTYQIVYPAPGAPEIATHVAELIRDAGIPVRLDDRRGYDHGAFVPLFVMYPKADVPVFQLSLQAGYDPSKHAAIGRSLAPLRDDGILIIGSGFSYHNLSLFGPGAKDPSEAFDGWLADILSSPPESRTAAILNWQTAPCARICHPREDHLAPLFVVIGTAENEHATRTYHERELFGGVTASSYRFG
jgi:aromatic ring-opening dioxygenase catalytic subunit (LigB family)